MDEELAQVVSQRNKSKKGGKKDTKSEMDESEILIEAGQAAYAADAKGSLKEEEKRKKPKIKITP